MSTTSLKLQILSLQNCANALSDPSSPFVINWGMANLEKIIPALAEFILDGLAWKDFENPFLSSISVLEPSQAITWGVAITLILSESQR